MTRAFCIFTFAIGTAFDAGGVGFGAGLSTANAEFEKIRVEKIKILSKENVNRCFIIIKLKHLL
jgi:hypothetical protein